MNTVVRTRCSEQIDDLIHSRKRLSEPDFGSLTFHEPQRRVWVIFDVGRTPKIEIEAIDFVQSSTKKRDGVYFCDASTYNPEIGFPLALATPLQKGAQGPQDL